MGKRPITKEDLLKLTFVGDPQTSPDGKRAAYVLTQMDVEKDGYYSSIYVTNFEDEGTAFTYHHDKEKLIKDTSPRWSPNGETLAFLSNRTGKNQVWLLPIGGGEAKPLTEIENGVKEFSWSPDGKRLALTIRGDVNEGKQREEETEDQEEKSDVKVITRLRYKMDGAGILDDKRNHIYLYELETGELTKVTDGDYDFSQARFSPDSKALYYVASKAGDLSFENIPSIWKYDLNAKEESLFFEGKGLINAHSPSPDGKWVAFVGHDRGAYSSGNTQVWIVSTETGEAKNLTGALDHPVGNLVGVDAKYDTAELRVVWDQNSSSVYFYATVGGDCQLFSVSLDGQVSEALSRSNANVTSFDLIDQSTAILVQGNPHSTGDLIIQDLSQVEKTTQISDWNQELFSEVALSTPENIKYKSTDGWEIEGWILKPYGFEKGKKYPLILQIHGGPHTSYGNGLHHEMQLMAAKGYVVLYTNPRGSHGYGKEFVRAVVGDYSGMDYEDIMAGVDHVLETKDYIDEDQLFVTGGSYGGYMTNVIVTKTNRFKAAVTQRSICNWYSFYGTSDIGFFFTWYQHGKADLWEDEEELMRISPIRYAKKVKTPTLVLHSEQDLRCPMEQAEQWYIALKRLGVETKLVRFPDEDHNLSRTGKPKHRLERLEHLIDWFEDRTE